MYYDSVVNWVKRLVSDSSRLSFGSSSTVARPSRICYPENYSDVDTWLLQLRLAISTATELFLAIITVHLLQKATTGHFRSMAFYCAVMWLNWSIVSSREAAALLGICDEIELLRLSLLPIYAVTDRLSLDDGQANKSRHSYVAGSVADLFSIGCAMRRFVAV